tara:strand:+ start:68 stop:604 length:537 start_codon:yes stop_codon:yes gene_type:complete
MGISTLLSTDADTDVANISITSNITSTYDEYMFVITDFNPAVNSGQLLFQASIDGGSNYNVAQTTTFWHAYHDEADSETALAYVTAQDIADGTGFQILSGNTGNGADESASGILHLFRPANTTFNKHYYSRVSSMHAGPYELDEFADGYFNTTSAINAVQFKANNGNMDCVIQMYGIA